MFLLRSGRRASATLACAFGVGLATPAVFAQDLSQEAVTEGGTYDEVVITSTPLERPASTLAQPVSILSGERLQQLVQPTLGETLATQPGVSASSYAPGASRPVIRGLDGERLRILQNGVAVNDASGASADHGVSTEPLLIRRVEIVRGPAGLLYGPSAIGGIVNVIDNRIPDSIIGGPVHGAIETRGNSATFERAIVGSFEGDAGPFAWHLDAFRRKSDDIDIPGFARSSYLRAVDPIEAELAAARRSTTRRIRPQHEGDELTSEPYGTVPNSATDTNGATFGLSYLFDGGYIGVAPSTYNSDYGVVAAPDVTIDLNQLRLDVAGAYAKPLPGLQLVRLKWGFTDYEHIEFEGAEVGTTFKNRGWDGRLEAPHEKVGPLEGAFGFQSFRSDFSAVGEEAFLPPVLTNTNSGFVFEEVDLDPVRLQLGVRLDHQVVESATDATFGPGATRRFTTPSGSVGLVATPADGWTTAASVAYTQRAPNYQELFADGPHIATATFEIGDRDLSVEKSLGVDVSVRKTAGRVTASATAFHNRFDDFIYLEPTGKVDFDDNLGISRYRNIGADFTGMEVEGTVRALNQGPHTLDVELRTDYVYAVNRDDNDPLPRIPPFRFGGSLVYRLRDLTARVDVMHAWKQDRTIDPLPGDALTVSQAFPTDAFTMVDASIRYRIATGPVSVEAWLKGSNLLDEEARNSVSFLKDVSPLPGRAALGGIRVMF